MKTLGLIISRLPVLAVATISVACTTAPATIQSGPDAEVSFDGLHKVDNSQADFAWAKPDFDISNYTKIMLVGAGVEYVPTKNRGRTSMERQMAAGGSYFIDDNARIRFEALVAETFLQEMRKIERFELVTEAGPDVLMIRATCWTSCHTFRRTIFPGQRAAVLYLYPPWVKPRWSWSCGIPKPQRSSPVQSTDALPNRQVDSLLGNQASGRSRRLRTRIRIEAEFKETRRPARFHASPCQRNMNQGQKLSEREFRRVRPWRRGRRIAPQTRPARR